MTYLVLHFKLFELRKFFLSTFLERKSYTISNTSDNKNIIIISQHTFKISFKFQKL